MDKEVSALWGSAALTASPGVGGSPEVGVGAGPGPLWPGRTGSSSLGPGKAAATASCPQVALRIRPLNDTELEEGAAVIAHKVGDQVRLSQGCRARPPPPRLATHLGPLSRPRAPSTLPSRKAHTRALRGRAPHTLGWSQGGLEGRIPSVSALPTPPPQLPSYLGGGNGAGRQARDKNLRSGS